MNIYSIEQLLALAKYTSPIYKELYANIDTTTPFDRLPVLTNSALMEIVHSKNPDFVFAEGNTHGLIFESSASTGKPKVTIWGRDEWESSMRILANFHWRNRSLRDGDRVANLCSSPYLSYRIVHSVIEHYPGKCSEIPVACDLEFEELYHILEKYGANVLAGVNSTILGLAWYLFSRGQVDTRVERILAGGELLYGSQRDLIRRAFPNATMISFMFGTTESGIIGYSELTDELNVFRAFPGVSIVEVLDESTREPITKSGRSGMCVVTSLLRVAAPAIRVDTGDRIEWLDEPTLPSPRFRLLGRRFPFMTSYQEAQFSETDVWSLIQLVSDHLPITKLQVELHDRTVEIVVALLDTEQIPMSQVDDVVQEALQNAMPMLSAHGVRTRCRVEPFSHFLAATRRKGRLLKDCRGLCTSSGTEKR